MTQSDDLLIMRPVHIDHLLAIGAGSEMQAMIFDIDGMVCGGCRVLVERRLGQLTGVSQATVALQPGLATVVLDPTLVT